MQSNNNQIHQKTKMPVAIIISSTFMCAVVAYAADLKSLILEIQQISPKYEY